MRSGPIKSEPVKSELAKAYITVDGSMGEGGGQVLRASLALSMALGKPFQMTHIRARRPKPGLKRQHLTCVSAAKTICNAVVTGDEINSTEISFIPEAVLGGDYTFRIGTGGSVTMVLQAIVPPLLVADAPSRLTVVGGTHVPYAPPFEFIQQTLFPQIARLGPRISAGLEKIGYMDVGGGSVRVEISPVPRLVPFQAEGRGDFIGAAATIYGHHLPEGITEREAHILLSEQYTALGLSRDNLRFEDGSDEAGKAIRPAGGGNAVLVTLHHKNAVSVFGEIGWRGRTAEIVARQACKRALEFLNSDAPSELHLADQLLVPMALAGGGSFVTKGVSSHTKTCLSVVELFTDLKAAITPEHGKDVRITLQ
jgi:RNA 3'-terminal phosphate cyclase (ATP)